MENPTTIAIDLSKNVFEIAVERRGRICQRKRLNRRQMVEFFSQCPSATVLMEACGSSHYWGRVLQRLGHEVRVVPVPVKSIEQQSVVFLHRLRATWMKTRTSRLNALRGILRELGVTIPEGASRVLPAVSAALSDPNVPIPEVLHPVLLSAMAEVRELDERIEGVKRQLEAVARTVPMVERLETIPGVGLLNATALAAMTGDFSRFPSGRRFASSLGLTPKEHSRGMRRWLGAISKRGDTYLRTLLIGGARSVLLSAHRTKQPHRLQEWALNVERKRGRNRAAVAVANKLARIVWAVATRGVPFHPIPLAPQEVPV